MIRLLAAALLCALFFAPAAAQGFLDGVVSIDVTMHRVRGETCVASQYGVGDGYHGRRTGRANGSTRMRSARTRWRRRLCHSARW
jgi:hypothetical protein